MELWILWIHVAINVLLLFFLVRITFKLALFVFGYRQTLPFVPTSTRPLRAIIDSGELEGKKKIVDLGCGNGTMIAAFAKKYPEADFVGVEKNWSLVWASRLRFLFWKKKPTIIHGDMFEYSVADADAIVGFWITGLAKSLMKKFEYECKSGCVIASNVFSLPESDLFTAESIAITKKRNVHIYKKK